MTIWVKLKIKILKLKSSPTKNSIEFTENISILLKEAKDGRNNSRQSKLLFLEGKQLLKEAIANRSNGVSMLKIFCMNDFVHRNEANKTFLNSNNIVKYISLSEEMFNKWSNMENSQGVFGIKRKEILLFFKNV